MEITQRNYTIDIFRLIASFFIVFLHVGYGDMNNETVAAIRISGRWGVPFFFLLSGYFFQRSMTKSPRETLNKTCVKIVYIMITVNILYIIFQYLIEGNFNWKHIFPGTYFHLWFLPSLIMGTLSVYLFDRYKIKYRYIMAISFFIIVVVLLSDSYAFTLPFASQNLGGKVIPLLSIPYMNFGAYLFSRNSSKPIKTPSLGILLVLLGFIIQIIEVNIIHTYSGRAITEHQYLIGTFILSFGILIIAFSINIKNGMLGEWGKEYSLFIYLYHPVLILLFYQINYKTFFAGNLIIFFPVMIFLLTLGIGILLNKLINPVFLILTGAFRKAP